MKDSGVAIMGSGRASGEGRAKRAVQMALESPLLNDNDINGANFILLNITYGADELLMDEISEITDYIQDQAGMGAEVIWGYGQDDTLGEDVCATVIATGFAAKTVDHVLPVSSEEPKKLWLEAEGAKEVTAKVEKPVAEVPEVRNELKDEEPFIKKVETSFEVEFEVQNNIGEEIVDDTTIPSLSSLKIQLDEELISDQPVYHNLGNNLNEIVSRQNQETPSDTLVHKEEAQVSDRPNRAELLARNKEREMRIREFTIKLKTPNGLNELENEPAYARKKISLDNSARSTESNISRYSLNESVDENGNKKVELKGNSFLHDNVD